MRHSGTHVICITHSRETVEERIIEHHAQSIQQICNLKREKHVHYARMTLEIHNKLLQEMENSNSAVKHTLLQY